MARSDDIARALVRELLRAQVALPKEFQLKRSGQYYRVIVQEDASGPGLEKRGFIFEDISMGPSGNVCGCCNGSGRQT